MCKISEMPFFKKTKWLKIVSNMIFKLSHVYTELVKTQKGDQWSLIRFHHRVQQRHLLQSTMQL